MTGIEIRTYEGDGADAAELLRRVWTESYRGKMWFPLWSAEFFRWQLGTHDREVSVAAYDDRRLVGCFFAVRHALRIGSEVFPMTFSSWCTLDPDYRLPRLGLHLIEALRRRHRETGQALSLGVVSGDPSSLALRFWTHYAKVSPQNFRFLFKFGTWVKILNPSAMARAGVAGWERFGIRSLGPVLSRTSWAGGSSDLLRSRPYHPDDLEACARLVEGANRGADWAVTWPASRLGGQLEGATPRTLVFEREHEVRGMVNYHEMPWQGREPIRVALIDLFAAPDLSALQQARLLGSLCHELRGHDIDAIVCLRSAMFPTGALIANAFVPLPARDHFVALFAQPQVPLERPKSWSLLLR